MVGRHLFYEIYTCQFLYTINKGLQNFFYEGLNRKDFQFCNSLLQLLNCAIVVWKQP